MIGTYLLKLALLLPAIGVLAWLCLKLTRRMQQRLGGAGVARSVEVVETTMLSPTLRLAVLRFHGRDILVSVSRHGLTRLAEAPVRLELEP